MAKVVASAGLAPPDEIESAVVPAKFYFSSDVNRLVQVRIAGVDGLPIPRRGCEELENEPYFRHLQHTRTTYSDLFVTVEVYADNKPLTIPTRTSSCGGLPRDQPTSYQWNELLTLPIKYRDLPVSARLVFTVWDPFSPQQAAAVGGTSIPMFTSKSPKLKEGPHRLFLWPNHPGDGSHRSSTPHKVSGLEQLYRLQKARKRMERGSEYAKLEWLDSLTLPLLIEQEREELHRTNSMQLDIRLERFQYPVIFDAKRSDGTWTANGWSNARQQVFGKLAIVMDPDADGENPVEKKHSQLARSNRHGQVHEENLKPNAAARNQLNKLMWSPSTRPLRQDEQDLLWRYRYHLSREKKALTKFLRSVEWDNEEQVRAACDLLPKWAPIDIEDALELLQPVFKHPAVRAYAAKRLESGTDDEELQLYLLQLVQALKYENFGKQSSAEDSALVSFLISRGISSPAVGNSLFWCLSVESNDERYKDVYSRVLGIFLTQLTQHPGGKERYEDLQNQKRLLNQLTEILSKLAPLNRQKKIERLRSMLAEPERGLETFPKPMPLMLDPSVIITGIVPHTANVFKSAKQPVFLTFRTKDGGEYSVIFKDGDDLQQDQLVMQLIRLMDRLLRKEKLDMHLTPYQILPTLPNQGFMQFVSAEPLASILDNNGNDLRIFLRKHNADPSAEFGISPAAMDTYVKSCAGYCVITYILGIGDRHLDNLLLTKDGNLLHIDFGFILGNDPKPFPPPMKLCSEMVQAMGGDGEDVPLVKKFRSYCYESYNTLRKSSNLILVLLALMHDSNVSNIAQDPDKAVSKVEENLQLQRSDEEAIQYMRDLISNSMRALFAQVVETVHKWAQYWRK